jgi:hypothetical protein
MNAILRVYPESGQSVIVFCNLEIAIDIRSLRRRVGIFLLASMSRGHID